MKKNYFLKTLLVVMVLSVGSLFSKVFAQNYYYLGTGTSSSSSTWTPFYTFYEDKRSTYLILASELQALGASGDLTRLAFDVVTPASQPMNGFNIKIGHTNLTSISGFVPGLTTVYSAASHTAYTGWNDFVFSTPFSWDGVSNIVVEVCWDNTYWTSASSVRYSTLSFQATYGQYADGQTGCSMTAGWTTNSNNRPNMRLEFSPSVANDVGLTALISPSFPACALDSTVKVVLINGGADTLTSATINWSVNGTPQTPYNWTGSLPSFATDTVSFGVYSGGFNDGDALLFVASMPNGVPDSNNVNDTLAKVLATSLSGTYTIDPSGNGDFLSFTDAIQALENYGLCGPTVFEAVDTTYPEQIHINGLNILGMSDSNTITFTSQSGDPTGVIVSYSSTGSSDNYVVKIENAMYVTFSNMSFYNLGSSYMTVLNGGSSHHITIDGCLLMSNVASSSFSSSQYNTYIYGADNDYWTLSNNIFQNGNRGLYLYGNYNDYNVGNKIIDNVFLDNYYSGPYISYQENMVLDNNYVTSPNGYSYGYGIRAGSLLMPQITNNHVEGSQSGWPYYGLYLFSIQGDLNQYAQIANNRVSMPGSGYYGMYLSNNLFTEIAFNSVMTNNSSSTSRAVYITSGAYSFVNNNIFQNIGGGYAIYLNGNGVYNMDYNNLSSPIGNIGYFGSIQATLADWVAATGFDSNSLSVDSIFTDTARLKVCTDSLYGMGTTLSTVTTDYEGDMRNDPPCIGADEFVPVSMAGFGDDPVLCDGDTLILTQQYFDTVIWNGNDTTSSITVTFPGTQTVAVYDACGTAFDTVNVQPQPMPQLGDSNLCEGESKILDPGIPNGTYMWNDGSTNATLMVSAAGTYIVNIIDEYGCSSADTSVVTQSMNVDLPDTNVWFCEGSSAVIDANMQGTYSWSTGETTPSIAVSAAGTYSVTVTDPFNCISEDTVVVDEKLNAVPVFTTGTIVYTTVSFINTSQNANSYLWDFGDGTTSTDPNPVHVYPWSVKDTCYEVTLTAINECGSVDSIAEVCTAVGVEELSYVSDFNIYPNPNSGSFEVTLNTTETVELNVEVINTVGQIVYNRNYGKVSGAITRAVNLTNATPGVYMVKVTVNDKVSVYRMSIQ